MRISVLATLFSLVIVSSADAQQVMLTAVRDNTLYETNDGSTSNGVGDYLFVGRVGPTGGGARRRALVRFDLGTIPAGATITSASLRMNVSKTTNGDQTVNVRRVTADWGEGTSNANSNEGSGAASTTGDATWIHRFKATSNWTTPGGDMAGVVSAGNVVGGVGPYTWSGTQMVADIQGWLTTPSTNFGWILVGDESTTNTSKRFDSRENPTSANRPQLTVNYTTATSVDGSTETPVAFGILANYPNPFNPSTQITFAIPSDQTVRLTIYNLLGVRVATLIDRAITAGGHTATWDATGMPSGLYFARLEAGGSVAMKRMVLAK